MFHMSVSIPHASSIALNSGMRYCHHRKPSRKKHHDQWTTHRYGNDRELENFGGFSGIEIQGNVNNHANLKTDASIIVAGNVGAASSLIAIGSINIGGQGCLCFGHRFPIEESIRCGSPHNCQAEATHFLNEFHRKAGLTTTASI